MCNGELQGAKPSIIDRHRTKMHPLSRALSIAEAMLASRVLELAAYAVIRTISPFHGKFYWRMQMRSFVELPVKPSLVSCYLSCKTA